MVIYTIRRFLLDGGGLLSEPSAPTIEHAGAVGGGFGDGVVRAFPGSGGGPN
jgi:hypothetical protein